MVFAKGTIRTEQMCQLLLLVQVQHGTLVFDMVPHLAGQTNALVAIRSFVF